MKIIAYSLFGYNKGRQENCFDFNSYLRGLMVNVRLQRLIYPEWKIRLYIDMESYEPFRRLFDNIGIEIKIMNNGVELCKAMLWRLIPAFEKSIDAVLCRDLDSPLTYKEAQCVQYWLNREDKIVHAITDSISHNIPMMGGMVGFKPKFFSDRLGCNSWDELINCGGNYNTKGTDQDLLNTFVYPKFATKGSESIVQHYLLGMPNSFLSEWHNQVPDIELNKVLMSMKESNDTCGHIGASGWYETATNKFLMKYPGTFGDIRQAEKEFSPEIFNWKI